MAWTSTTLVVVEVEGGGKTGLGYTYTDGAAAQLIGEKLAETVRESRCDGPARRMARHAACGAQHGPAGLAATAISAVDTALWDLKAKLLDLPLALLLGRYRDAVPIYGSGGFTTYSDGQLRDQLAGWVERDGCRWVKMKVGTDPAADPGRVDSCEVGDRRPHAVRRRQRRLQHEAGAGPGRHVSARSRSRLVRGAGVVRRSGRSADVAAARAGRMEIAAGEYGYTTRLFSPDAECRRGRCAAGGHHPVRRRHGFLQVGRAMRGASYRSVRSLRARDCICTPPVPRRGFAIWSGFTTMSASNTCCSMARRRHAMASSDRTCRGPAWGWRSNGTMPHRYRI